MTNNGRCHWYLGIERRRRFDEACSKITKLLVAGRPPPNVGLPEFGPAYRPPGSALACMIVDDLLARIELPLEIAVNEMESEREREAPAF